MKIVDQVTDIELNEMIIDSLNKSGSDKNTDHNYAHAYTYLFNKTFINRNDEINFLEIGIANQTPEFSSLHAWAKIFSNAKIFGIDIDPGKMIHSDRISTYTCSQNSLVDLSRFRQDTGYCKFDIILDDGSHIFSDALYSFEYLFKSLKTNGLYMIEDVSKLSQSWEQTVDQWESYLSLKNNLEYEIIDCKPGTTDDSVIVAIWKINKLDGNE